MPLSNTPTTISVSCEMQRGLVTRTADPHDGRWVRVTLTESARGLVPAITAAIGDRITPAHGAVDKAPGPANPYSARALTGRRQRC
ncbi:MAG: hypothetical protein WCC28_05380 [Mycobacterium sp.]|uniref:hypothetical protein n=1 Tax=Mycobacterium sp. TaxID=1785 RepID=UPI003C7918DC